MTELDHAVVAMRNCDSGKDYFAATLLGGDRGWTLGFYSHFVDWPEGKGSDDGVELRRASVIDPERVAKTWDEMGQAWLSVTTPGQLMIFWILGGNALIEVDLAETLLSDHVDVHPVVRGGALGFVAYDETSRFVTQARPTPAMRMRVLERDGFRCQLCGERPTLNEHVVLHVHHIRPFGRGGLTAEENLITLCHTCHMGLEPHEKLRLFEIPGGQRDRELQDQSPESFLAAVNRYRSEARGFCNAERELHTTL